MIKPLSKEWHEIRKRLITASNCAPVIDKGFKTSEELMREKVRAYFLDDDPEKFTGNIATEWGVEHEFAAVAEFERVTGINPGEETFFYEDWLGATPDGLTDDNSTLQVKCPFGIRHDKKPVFKKMLEGELEHYYIQVQIEMYVADRPQCHFFQWTPYGYSHEIIPKNDDFLNENIPKFKAFYDRYLEIVASDKLSAPYLESLEIDMSDNEHWRNIEVCYLDTLAELGALKKQADGLKKQLLDMTEGKRCFTDNVTVYKTEKKGAISYAKAIKEFAPNADLEQFRGKSSEYWTIKIKSGDKL